MENFNFMIRFGLEKTEFTTLDLTGYLTFAQLAKFKDELYETLRQKSLEQKIYIPRYQQHVINFESFIYTNDDEKHVIGDLLVWAVDKIIELIEKYQKSLTIVPFSLEFSNLNKLNKIC